ncbi:MAG: hypothetical protein NC191_01465 [Muribaculaceae bacterium]|nr:hypothetical protein [Muribaculaceae bacterium]
MKSPCSERSEESFASRKGFFSRKLPQNDESPVTLNSFQGLSMLIHPVRGKRLQGEKFKILKKILKRVQDDTKGVSSNDKFFAQINNRHCEAQNVTKNEIPRAWNKSKTERSDAAIHWKVNR